MNDSSSFIKQVQRLILYRVSVIRYERSRAGTHEVSYCGLLV